MEVKSIGMHLGRTIIVVQNGDKFIHVDTNLVSFARLAAAGVPVVNSDTPDPVKK